LKALGATVLAGSPPELASLVAGVEGVTEVYVDPAEVPAFDVYSPLMSLPALLNVDEKTIPADVPYLRAPREKLDRWREILPPPGNGLRIGLAWSGNPQQEVNTRRAISFGELLPLLQIEEVLWFSLQKGSPREHMLLSEARSRLCDCADALSDFGDTAAAIEHLDLVVTTDTSVAHLAGALGKPVWTLLSFMPDWRWGGGTAASRWYPTMRLFRQTLSGDWEPVIRRVGTEIEALRRRPT
jgi:hypothetical protein